MADKKDTKPTPPRVTTAKAQDEAVVAVVDVPEGPVEAPPGTDPLALPETGAPVPPKITKTGKARETNYFCLNADHPGGPGLRAELYDESRHFTSSEGGSPTCPKCNRPGSSLVVDDPDKLPPSIQLIKDRFEAAERGR